MFCPECGKPAQGKFCSNCGFALAALGATANSAAMPAASDLDHEIRYEAILQFPGVRTKIEQHARMARSALAANNSALAEKLIPTGVPIEALTGVAQPLLTQLGIETGKQRTEGVAAPRAGFWSALCARLRGTASRYAAWFKPKTAACSKQCFLRIYFRWKESCSSEFAEWENRLKWQPRCILAARFMTGVRAVHCLEQLFSDLARRGLIDAANAKSHSSSVFVASRGSGIRKPADGNRRRRTRWLLDRWSALLAQVA